MEGDTHKAKEKGKTEATRGQGDGRVLCVGGSADDQLGHNSHRRMKLFGCNLDERDGVSPDRG